MIRTKRLLRYLLIIFLLLLTGYYRDFVFRSINALLQAWDSDRDYYMPPSLRFIENYDYTTILNIKWLLTFFFCIIYLCIALLAIRLIFHNRKYSFITIGAYAGIVTLSAIFIVCGKLFNDPDKMYEFARYFMGLAQSPLVLMILVPVFKIAEKEKVSGMQ